MAKLENLNKYNFQDKLPTPVLKPLSKNRFYQNRVLRFLKAQINDNKIDHNIFNQKYKNDDAQSVSSVGSSNNQSIYNTERTKSGLSGINLSDL